MPVNSARLLAAPILILTLLAAPSPPAVALYGDAASGSAGAELVSADYARLEQADDATVFAAISAHGRYVAIQTRARNFFGDDDPDPPGMYRAGGVFRFDLQARTLRKVADGDLFDEGSEEFIRRGASNPSISADGRYVAFATAEPLAPADTNDNVDVYVRDMNMTGPTAFDLVSARDGGDVPAAYGPPAFPFPGSEPGADVSRGVAISADGQKVAFRTDAPSDLPARPAADVPAGQVFVRDRLDDRTTLVTAVRDSLTGEMTGQPAGGAVGAALSGDGTTVAWTGGNAGLQARFLGGENPEPGFLYYLWRRIADGGAAPTRRITGLADPDDPACPAGSETFFDATSTGACYGPLTDQEANRSSIAAQLPALSGDGLTVAFLTGAGPRPVPFTGTGLDLYTTRMNPGLSRKQATVELTRDPATFDTAASSPLGGLSMSPDGRYVAFTTVRTTFTLPALQLLGPRRPVPGIRELYVVDIQSRTLERAAHSTVGSDINADVQNGVSLSANGERLAFTSFASNLFFGDANQRADAFVVTRRADTGAGALPPKLGTGGPAGTLEFSRGGPQIGLKVRSRDGGLVALTVTVPAAGGVRAVAKASAGTPRKPRTLATASGRATGASGSSVRLLLRPVERYRDELRRRGQIRGRVVVTYVASRGGRRASVSRPVSFLKTVSSGQARKDRK